MGAAVKETETPVALGFLPAQLVFYPFSLCLCVPAISALTDMTSTRGAWADYSS